MNQMERRDAIKELLFTDRNAQIQNLADRFGVSVRTIKYDIEALTCSYPIETVRGRYGGGVKLADWYYEIEVKDESTNEIKTGFVSKRSIEMIDVKDIQNVTTDE